ncbi:carboxypeptidase S1 [Microdochium trichocladiopsis]|uniref:Carboxypeptidase S1 n=1 Tax=Microdochium trichocladiopsis TaxID=1682393 RepID=A0A9P9BR10_9PEZI|nr:carboxypeptidase S1 [Microdochium trichocladiopsis]KAH7031457.1 carboxypeptidase S1 [Microdochium trichocladiopsis]
MIRAIVGSTLVSMALGQFLTPPTTLTQTMGAAGIPVRYKQVPAGICELDPDVKSYSGYSDVGEDQHIFWWFFEARNQNPSDAPLTVYISGGPGTTSMVGLFEEVGPCTINPEGNVVNNPNSWSNASNLLFVDQPNFTGFSYGTPVPAYWTPTGDFTMLPGPVCPDYAPPGSCGTYSLPNITSTANSTENAAPAFWKTLQGFMGAFPQYSQNGYHFASESYGGHYGPVFNAYIEKQNDLAAPGTLHIDVKSVLIGNGWYDPVIHYQAYYNFTVWPGNTYDYAPFNASVEARFYNALYGPGNCLDGLAECKRTGDDAVCKHADAFCYNNVERILGDVAGRDEYDMRELVPDPFPHGYWQSYINTPKVQETLGVFVNSTGKSPRLVLEAFTNTGDDGRDVGAIEALRFLVGRNITVALYAGDADYNCNWLGGEVVADKVGAPGFAGAGYVDVVTSDGVMHAQTKQAGSFSFTRVFLAGHEVPFYQPLTAFEMFARVIGAKDVATGRVDVDPAYRTIGPAKSTYREGNATVQWEVVPENATYDVVTGQPGPAWGSLKFHRGRSV